MKVNKAMNKDKRSYEFSALPPKIVIGILLIAVGGLSLLALLMVFPGCGTHGGDNHVHGGNHSTSTPKEATAK